MQAYVIPDECPEPITLSIAPELRRIVAARLQECLAGYQQVTVTADIRWAV